MSHFILFCIGRLMWQKSTGLICIMLTNKWSQINGPKKKKGEGHLRDATP